MQKTILFALILPFGLLTACGSTSSMSGAGHDAQIDLAPYSRLLIEDFSDDATTRADAIGQIMLKPKLDKAIRRFPDRIVYYLGSTSGFATVDRTGTPDALTLILRGDIHQYDDGNEGMRAIFSFWAGNTNFDSTVELVDAATGGVLAVWKVDENSWATPMGDMSSPQTAGRRIAPTPDVLMDKAARKIAGELSGWKRAGMIDVRD